MSGISPPHKDLKVLVTKTPSVDNVDLFFRIFPAADLLILIRDGRAVVESASQTFYRSFAHATRQWASRAAAITRFVQNDSGTNRRYLVVKYEDLYGNTHDELRRILLFLHLDVARYNFEAARNLPVRGSSTLRRQRTDWQDANLGPGIHWHPVPKSPDFNPLMRWKHWNRAKHERFNWIAGDYLASFGYERNVCGGSSWLWNTYNWLLDKLPMEISIWAFNKAIRELRCSSSKVRAAVGLASRICGALRASGQK